MSLSAISSYVIMVRIFTVIKRGIFMDVVNLVSHPKRRTQIEVI